MRYESQWNKFDDGMAHMHHDYKITTVGFHKKLKMQAALNLPYLNYFSIYVAGAYSKFMEGRF